MMRIIEFLTVHKNLMSMKTYEFAVRLRVGLSRASTGGLMVVYGETSMVTVIGFSSNLDVV